MSVLVSDADWATLQEMARAWREGRINTPSRPPTPGDVFGSEDYLAPEVYVAKPQSAGGIPALVGKTPGSDTCDIYKIGTDGDLAAVTSFEKEVFNLSAEILPQEFIPVERTKYGKWITPKPATSTPAVLRKCVVDYELTEADTDSYTKDTTLSDDNTHYTVSSSGLTFLTTGFHAFGFVNTVTVESGTSFGDTDVNWNLSGGGQAHPAGMDIRIDGFDIGTTGLATARGGTGIILAVTNSVLSVVISREAFPVSSHNVMFWVHTLQ